MPSDDNICLETVKKCVEAYKKYEVEHGSSGDEYNSDNEKACKLCLIDAKDSTACVNFNKQYVKNDHDKFSSLNNDGKKEVRECFWPDWKKSETKNHCDIGHALTKQSPALCENYLFEKFKTLPVVGNDDDNPGCDVYELIGLIAGNFCKDAPAIPPGPAPMLGPDPAPMPGPDPAPMPGP